MSDSDQARIGVYVCHCGSNIAAVVDVREVVAQAAVLPAVAVARECKYLCSSTGQEMIKQDITEPGLNRVVVASCSPHLHESTFRSVLDDARAEPLLAGYGQHSRAMLLDHDR